MQIIDSKNMRFDFMGKRRLAVIFSAALILVSLLSLVTRGLDFGIDFTGGYLIEVSFEQPADLDKVRAALAENGFADASVQSVENVRDVLVRMAPRADGVDNAELSLQVRAALESVGEPTVRRNEFVGPQVGEELREEGGLAMLYALALILVYVAIRFEWRFAVGAVAALIHDVVLTLGVFSLLQIEFNLSVLAAILAVIGYSLNDTIVVFDRIRENFRILRKEEVLAAINISINQTLSRTIVTGVTTLLVLLALFFLGGKVIHGFSLALIVGVVVGTFSSVYIASATAFALGVSRQDLMPVKKEGEEQDAMP